MITQLLHNKKILDSLKAENITEYNLDRFRLYSPDSYEDFISTLEHKHNPSSVSIIIHDYKYRIITDSKH